MSKRKTDELRAEKWASCQHYCKQADGRTVDGDAVAHTADIYWRGMKRGRAELRKEIGEKLKQLLREREAVPFTGIECEGILLAAATLGIKLENV